MVAALLAALAAWTMPSAGWAAKPDQNPGQHTGQTVGVMTRNLYLGADLSPAIGAPNLPAFVAANGAILRQVTRTDFPTRAKGLADEILSKNPDLVGLQEVALWRTGPPSLAPVCRGTGSDHGACGLELTALFRPLSRLGGLPTVVDDPTGGCATSAASVQQ